MRRVKWIDHENQMEGWFHKFSTSSDEPGIFGPIAIVELDDGTIQIVGIGQYFSFRFVTPYQPEARAKGGASPNWQQPQAEIADRQRREREWLERHPDNIDFAAPAGEQVDLEALGGDLGEALGISGGAGFDSIPSAFGDDPMQPDYERLAADGPTSQIQDSRDSAGI